MKIPVHVYKDPPGMKLLIIEDEEILARVLKEKFVKEGFQVELAMDGISALPGVENFRPDLIILDLILPGKDGFQVLRELKAHPDFKRIPVIVLSNLGQDEEIKSALNLGAEDYLVKTKHPINEVVEKVKTYLIKPK